MKNSVGAIIRLLSSLIFLIGIMVCFFSIINGCLMIVLCVIGWNVAGRLFPATIYKREDVVAMKKIEEDRNEKQVKPVIKYETIDYTKVPYDLKKGWLSEQNRNQALKDILVMNTFLEQVKEIADIRGHFSIEPELVKWYGNSPSIFEFPAHTKTGKVPKYILILHFNTRDSEEYEPLNDYFGDIYYMQDGSIGKANLVCWEGKTMHRVELGLKGTTLIIKKIQKTCIGESEMKVIYKA